MVMGILRELRYISPHICLNAKISLPSRKCNHLQLEAHCETYLEALVERQQIRMNLVPLNPSSFKVNGSLNNKNSYET